MISIRCGQHGGVLDHNYYVTEIVFEGQVYKFATHTKIGATVSDRIETAVYWSTRMEQCMTKPKWLAKYEQGVTALRNFLKANTAVSITPVAE